MPHNLFQGRMAWANEVPWHGASAPGFHPALGRGR